MNDERGNGNEERGKMKEERGKRKEESICLFCILGLLLKENDGTRWREGTIAISG